MTDKITNNALELIDDAIETNATRELTITELEAVSGGCESCTRNGQEPGCTCKPSPGIP
jgi:bacteriocin-like protein